MIDLLHSPEPYSMIYCTLQNRSHVLHMFQILQKRHQIQKFTIVQVVKPARDGYRIRGMEHVATR